MIDISSEGLDLDSHLGGIGIGKDVSEDELCIKSAQQLENECQRLLKD